MAQMPYLKVAKFSGYRELSCHGAGGVEIAES